jgi:hypothetical protein
MTRRRATTLQRVVSGGQTGVDRAALDAAIALGIPHGGWCPRGRRAEDGPIPERYAVVEHASPEYAARTERNVIDADGTLVVTIGVPCNGTALTARLAERHRKPCLVVDLDDAPLPDTVADWIATESIGVLNVAGPRESTHPGIGRNAMAYLERIFAIASGA